MIKGKEFGNCNCAYGCPCQFNAPSTNGFCEGIVSILIEEGNFDRHSLDGLSFCLIYHWPGEIAEGNGRSQLIIDERADEKQREAINNIAQGNYTSPGSTHFYVFNSTMSEVLESIYAPIEMKIDVDARQAQTKIEGLVQSIGTPLIDSFSGKEDRKRIHLPNGFEYTYAEMGNGDSKITAGINLNLKDSYGQFNILHMNQYGVIRNDSRSN